MHYKALLEIGRKKKNERKIFVRSENGIVGVLRVVNKIRTAKLLQAKEISLQEYIAGVAAQL